MLGVVKLVTPEPAESTVPPVAAAYQSMVSPLLTVAVKATSPGPHRLKDPVPTDGTAGTALIVAVTAVLVGDTQFVEVFLASA